MNFILVALGGFFGSICRYVISVKVTKRLWATWIANITGSVLLAFMFKFHLAGTISTAIWLMIGGGFCGAYTTFSTFGNETLALIIEKRYIQALGYVATTLSVSLFFIALIIKVF